MRRLLGWAKRVGGKLNALTERRTQDSSFFQRSLLFIFPPLFISISLLIIHHLPHYESVEGTDSPDVDVARSLDHKISRQMIRMKDESIVYWLIKTNTSSTQHRNNVQEVCNQKDQTQRRQSWPCSYTSTTRNRQREQD